MASTTPSWVPLAVAAVGVLGTLSAAIFTQILTARREDRRRREDRDEADRRRQKDYEEQEERRLQTTRQTVYVDMSMSFQAWHDNLILAWKAGDQGVELSETWAAQLNECEMRFSRSFAELVLVGTPNVVYLASKLGKLCMITQEMLGKGVCRADPDTHEFQHAWRITLNAMRQDLSIPGPEIGLNPKQP